MFRVKKIISLFLAVLCITVMFAGCKIEVPAKVSSQAQSELFGTAESDSMLSQPESDPSSVANSSPAASASKTQSAVSKTGSSKSASSKAAASVAVSKASSSSAPTQSSAPADNKKYCTLMISCETILNHMNELDPATKSIIPANGILYAKQKLEFKDGDTVFDVLKHEKDAGHLKFEYQGSSAYNSVYIQSIEGLGQTLSESGWMYRVNSTYKNVGCTCVKLKNNDQIEWHYTCSTGRDLR